MRKIFTLLLLVAGFAATAQQYNKEWIKYGQTYYKFKVGNDGLYRIPKSLLDANGLGNVSVEFLELWRNGEKVPFYSSVPNGVLPSNGYLEFWGERNDGEPDKALYRQPEFQHTTEYSLQTDTAAYFLSVNTNQSGFRYNEVFNNVAGNGLPVEPYFMDTAGYYYKSATPNPGFASLVGVYVYSSSYDKGEFFSSGDIGPSNPLTTALSDLKVYGGGPASLLKVGATGNAPNARHIKINVNGVEVKDTALDYFNDLVTTIPVNTGDISSGTAAVQFINTNNNTRDRMRVSFFEFTYPRTFDFNGQSNFGFELPAKASGYFLQISNFNFGGTQPVLYDRRNGERFVGDVAAGMVRFALPGSGYSRHLVLVSEEAANITTITQLTPRVFKDYKKLADQHRADYLIISNPILYTGSRGNNPVEDYKNYRESAAGGSHKVLIADIDELVDQFAYGIKKHPLSVRNFISYAKDSFAAPIKDIFLIGRGVNYSEYQYAERNPNLPNNNLIERVNLVPTFGYPGSDNLMSAKDITVPVPAIPIGRLSVVRGEEIEYYLNKIKEYEAVQKTTSNSVADKGWWKNVVHVTGSSDAYLGVVLCNYMEIYEHILKDTLFGANVHTFCKASTNPNEQVSPEKLAKLFAEGITFLTYFGHSSATTLEFNIDNPENYNNQGKYPVFFVNGCQAGDFFTYYPQRLSVNETLSEKFTLAPNRGTIGFVASTHYGIVNYLNLYLSGLYGLIAKQDYDKTLGETMRDAMGEMISATGNHDFYSRMHAEQITLHGDPAIFINAQPKPDYIIEDQFVQVNPAFISVAENRFSLKVKAINLGKAPADSIILEIKRQYPDGSTSFVYREKIPGIRYADSITLNVPIVASRDKGLNKLIVTIDAGNVADEISESNNTITKQFYIYENEARPAYPYMYAIINNPTQTLYASTANPFSPQRNYIFEIDTTGAFNSSLKVSKTISGPGGILEFNPGITYKDSTVYYWRVATEPEQGSEHQWITSSFMYMPGTTEGYAQDHYHQNLKSISERVTLDTTTRQWKYGTRSNNLFINTGTWGISAFYEQEVEVSVDGHTIGQNFCAYSSVAFMVFDPVSFKPWKNNYDPVTGDGQYGSWNNCYTMRDYNFEFRYQDSASREKMRQFMEDVIPDGYYVVARSGLRYPSLTGGFAQDWINDTLRYGQYKSIYHSFLKYGFTEVDSFSRPRQFIFVYKKNDNANFTPVFKFTKGTDDKATLSVNCITPDTIGYITSPVFGPAKKWKEVSWKGESLEDPSPDGPSVEVVGVANDNTEALLYTLDKNTHNFDLSAVDASRYPFMKLRMRNIDSLKLTPYQLKSWRVYCDPAPEGSMAANLYLTQMRDTFTLGETATFGIAFKNISNKPFDSIKVKAVVIDQNNVSHTLFVRKQKPIISGDTIHVSLDFGTTAYPGSNVLFVDVNADNDQPEQYFFNNFVYKNFYVWPDNKNPILDVTFDGVHILNRDIVSSKPNIEIKLKDESSYLLLNDTSLASVQVKYPDGTLRTYSFDNDTLRFIPATSGSENTATIQFTPQFNRQINPEGDVYELIVVGKDRSGNKAGNIAYRIAFTVISKPMISNVLNYPNPFSTSTAFVFTITGSEIPQNIRIQILTVTGKIVREITMNELGPLHIGRNITEFKWDGTDQYGQKLGNGVYLYRIITSLNGKTMEKYKSQGDNTDQYFNNGYGKMYLMR
ncbi:C25 family cysteine peptidase [Longitalea arenae]|uniref:putative type IX secretion system sortase PorU2 n=1 Tax=Longitalea arenae TaxID=2812558 RepID=UPI0019675A1A|nr:C25 family cysteine peptidase [Longitalea arenae]